MVTREDNKNRAQEKSAARESLAGIPLFESLSEEEILELEKSCRWCEFREKEKVIECGEDSREVYFITSGNTHVLNYARSGRIINFAVLGPGDFFGELAAIDGLERSATVVAKSPCRMIALQHRAFLTLVTSNPEITLTVLNRLAGVVRRMDERVIDSSALGSEQMVCVELLRLAIPDPAFFDNYDNLVVYPMPTHQRIAQNIGLARETVSRVLSHLHGEGIIEKRAKTLYIRKKSALEALVLALDENP